MNEINKIKYFDELPSTHLYVKENQDKLENGTVIIANKQTAGIGTHGRTWYTGSGDNIAMSMLFKPECDLSSLNNITVDVAQSIKKTIRNLYNIGLNIKYPNDLLLNGKKICGILTEINTISGKINYLIISLGFNVNEICFDEETIKIATSLKKEYNKNFNRKEIILKIIENINNIVKSRHKTIQN